MKLNAWLSLILGVIGIGVVWGCGDGRNSPTSPSAQSSRPAPGARSVSLSHLRRVDSDGDGYEDPELPGGPPTPGEPAPGPDPGQFPPSGEIVPVQLTINITASFPAAAFAPN